MPPPVHRVDHGYHVLPSPYGIAITGPCPLSHLHGLTKIACDEGFDETAPDLAAAMGATYLFVSAASRDTWRAELEKPSWAQGDPSP